MKNPIAGGSSARPSAPRTNAAFTQMLIDNVSWLGRQASFKAKGKPITGDSLAQQTHLLALQKKASFHGPDEASFKAWLRKILTNVFLMWLFRTFDRTRKRGVVSLDAQYGSNANLAQDLAAACPSPSKHLQQAELEAALRSSIADLPQELKTVFVLHVFEEHTTAEIAKQLGVGIRIVQLRLIKARTHLQKSLERFGIYGQ